MTNVNNANIFEVATRNGFRFQYKGMISVEDLWVLNVRELDSIFKGLNSQLKQVQEESLLDVKTKQDQELDMQIEIVKHIVKVKQEEENVRLQAKEQKAKKQKLMEILSEKEDESLKNMSAEEIKKMLNDLEG